MRNFRVDDYDGLSYWSGHHAGIDYDCCQLHRSRKHHLINLLQHSTDRARAAALESKDQRPYRQLAVEPIQGYQPTAAALMAARAERPLTGPTNPAQAYRQNAAELIRQQAYHQTAVDIIRQNTQSGQHSQIEPIQVTAAPQQEFAPQREFAPGNARELRYQLRLIDAKLQRMEARSIGRGKAAPVPAELGRSPNQMLGGARMFGNQGVRAA
jgi:hypothetical protein